MTEPARIVVEGGRAIGIETTEGEKILARHLVASSLNPHQTFLELLEPSVVPGEIREQADQTGTVASCWISGSNTRRTCGMR